MCTQDRESLPEIVTHINPIKSQPGSISVNQIVGRDRLARDVWKVLIDKSVRLENERRVGKTLLIDKMISLAPANMRCIKMEIGGVASSADFVSEILNALEKIVPEYAKSIRSLFHNAVKAFAGVEVGGILRLPPTANKHWREILKATLVNVISEIENTLVFFWDEMPWMLENIERAHNISMVDQVLGTLRDIRQDDTTKNRIRMVYTGSIGFHHLEDKLIKAKLANAQNNDMTRIQVPPLDENATAEFVHRVCAGERLVTDNLTELTQALHEGTDGMAFYIHHLIIKLADLEVARAGDARSAIDESLRLQDDPWKMRHYLDRIKKYYETTEWTALTVIDALAIAPEPVHFSELYQRICETGQTPIGIPSKSDAVELLRLLALDHYIVETSARFYAFKFTIIKRWWYLARGLDL